MKPQNLKTKIFLDSGDPKETKETLKLLGFLDGQTTNPSLIAKNPVTMGKKFSKDEIFSFYKDVVSEISNLIPDGSVSVEVYADKNTKSDEMFEQGSEMFSWIPNAHIKYPTTHEGLMAAEKTIKQNMRVNMTLVFSQEQAAAVYAATMNSEQKTSNKFKNVFISPFVGRLDDRGENGMDLIENIIKMYKNSDHHVELLTASVRSLDHFLEAIRLESDIITAPFNVLKEWAEKGFQMPNENFKYDSSKYKSIPYEEIDLGKDWKDYYIQHDLTDTGIDKFSKDWNSLLVKE